MPRQDLPYCVKCYAGAGGGHNAYCVRSRETEHCRSIKRAPEAPGWCSEIEIRHNPDETGSFLIRWRLHRYVMSPNGEVAAQL